jgi:hypothetical protein
MRETAIQRAMESTSPEARTVCYWAFRLSTAAADQPRNLYCHEQWISRKLNAAIDQFSGASARTEEPEKHSVPISREQAAVRTALLKASL